MFRGFARQRSAILRSLRTLRPTLPVNYLKFQLQTQTPARHLVIMGKKKTLDLPVYDPTKTFNKDDKDFNPIVWIDCEMTGLDVFNDHIIEICCIVTNGNLEIVDEGYESVVHYDKSVMDAMNEWCIQHHGDSGLTKQVIESTKTLEQVEEEVLEYLKKFTNKGTAVLGGNSVHMDRAFMMREFPRVLEHLHYRIIDVSSISEVGKRHNKELMNKCPKKREAHTARADILESIAQLKWFRDNYFVQPETKAE